MEHFEFIKHLIDTRKFNSGQKDRLLALIGEEMSRIDTTDKKVWKEIEIIKRKLGLIQDDGKYIDPRGTTTFLNKFNDDVILKSATHLVDVNELAVLEMEFDAKYSYDLHLSRLKKRFGQLSKEYRISTKLYAKINAYINGGRNWSEDKIEVNWSHPSIKEWSESNNNQCPNPDEESLRYESFPLPNPITVGGRVINTFSELVLEFKKQIQVRPSNSFSHLFTKWGRPYIDRAEVNIVSEETGISLFTDIEKLGQIFEQLMDLCIEVARNREGGIEIPIIEVSFKEVKEVDLSRVIVSIHHINTVYETNKHGFKRTGQTLGNMVDNLINGLCDFEIEAVLEDGFFLKKSVWPEAPSVKEIGPMEGVRYNLIFYKQ